MKTFKFRHLFIAATLALFAFGSATAADYKIGVVNAVRVLEAAPQSEVAKKKLEKEFGPRDKDLLNAQKELKSLEDRLEKDGAIMSESERSRVQRDILNQKRELKRGTEEFREDINFRRNEEFSKIQRMIVEAIQAVGKEQKFDLVLGEGVIFASDKIDLTNTVIERLKKQ